MLLYDLYCPNCRKAYHYELWKTCGKCQEKSSCRYCGWCDGDWVEETCNADFPSEVPRLGSE